MLLIVLAYLGGVLTIVSPCILPVLPFVFARADRQLHAQHAADAGRDGADLRVVATLAAVGGGWAVQANAVGRWARAGPARSCSAWRWYSRRCRIG